MLCCYITGGILWEDVILDKEVELAEHFAVTAIGFRNPTAEKMHFRFLNISGMYFMCG